MRWTDFLALKEISQDKMAIVLGSIYIKAREAERFEIVLGSLQTERVPRTLHIILSCRSSFLSLNLFNINLLNYIAYQCRTLKYALD